MRGRNTLGGFGIEHRDFVLVAALLVAIAVLLLWPAGQKRHGDGATERVEALVTGVDNEQVETFGVVNQGEQAVTLKILGGNHAGETVTAFNSLLGDPELDWLFSPGQRALVAVNETDDGLLLDVLGPYRLRVELYLTLMFFLLLVAVAGWVGAKAILSFVFSVLLIWKALIPLCLAGYDPIIVSLGIVATLTGVITLLVGGVSRKGVTAFLGGFLGLLTTCVLAMLFAPEFHLIGTTRPFAKSLLFTNPQLDVYRFFIAGVFIACSGAVMDLAMDIAAAMQEIKQHHPAITGRQLFTSGLKVGQAVVGTMTTTLLLAYSGGYMMMLAHFMSQEIPLAVMMNSTFFSSEMLNTMVGSFGLVTVAPFSALVGALLFSYGRQPQPNDAAV